MSEMPKVAKNQKMPIISNGPNAGNNKNARNALNAKNAENAENDKMIT